MLGGGSMSERFGISGGGRSAEELFRQITGAAPAERAAEGDALLEGRLNACAACCVGLV